MYSVRKEKKRKMNDESHKLEFFEFHEEKENQMKQKKSVLFDFFDL